MIYLTAIFLPPLYFFIKGRVLAGIVHSILGILSVLCLMTMIFAPAALIFWLISSACAILDLRHRTVDEQTTMMARKMAQAMQESQKP